MHFLLWNSIIFYILGLLTSWGWGSQSQASSTLLSNPNTPQGLICESASSQIEYNGPFEICIGQATGLFSPIFGTTDPNLVKPRYTSFVINEADGDTQGNDTAEFIEILGPPDSSLRGFVVVLFNGAATSPANASYRVIDLDRFSTDSCGFFLIHGPRVTDPHPSHSLYDTLITVGNGFIQNGPDAIALYRKATYLNATAPLTDSLVDALVYHNATGSIDLDLLDKLNESTQYVENTATSLARMPDHAFDFVRDSTPTPGHFNTAYDASYSFIWLLTLNDSIYQTKEGNINSSYAANFTIQAAGDYCVYGLSVYGTFTNFIQCEFNTISEISDSIATGFCGTFSADCEPILVTGGFNLISAAANECSTFDDLGTYRVHLKWLGVASGPFEGPLYTSLVSGVVSMSGDTSCFISDPIPGGDTLVFRLYNGLCADTLTSFITQFCDYCSLMTPPDALDQVQICESGPYIIAPFGGGIPQIKPASDLFITEYVEGSSFNKCIELYNGTPNVIDLAAEQYIISIFYNGSIAPFGPIALSGVISPGATFVLCHNQANATLMGLANQLSSFLDFNGDDAIVLTHLGDTIDIIGQIGVDPGGQWGAGSQSTQDNTLRRNGAICKGDTITQDFFNPATDWSGHAVDDFTGLGTHGYTAQEFVVDYYNYYSADPLIGGVLIGSGTTYQAVITPGTIDTIYVSGYRADYDCESTAVPVQLTSTQSNLICNDHVHVTLPAVDCFKSIVAADVMENPGYCTYVLKLNYPNGTNSSNLGNVVDRSHIGYKMSYQASDLFGNSCWGYITIEDKSSISYRCRSEIISCFQLQALIKSLDTIQDGCQGKIQYQQESFFTDSGCTATYLGKWIRRVRTIDQWKNSYTCQDTFLIKKNLFNELMEPDDIRLSCDLFSGYPAELFIPDSLLSYRTQGLISEDLKLVPTIDGYNIYPSLGKACNLTPTYSDLVAPLCGSGISIRREWRIIDWCTLEDTVLVQYIKIEDNRAPRPSTSLPILEANTGPHDCYGRITRYRRLNFSDCSEIQSSITYSYIEPGTLKLITVAIELFDPIRLPVGTHQVLFTAIDPCGFQTQKAVDATVRDMSAPEVVCIDNTVITLDPLTCWSRVYAQDFDNGSTDNCQKQLHYALATMDSILYWRNYWLLKLESLCTKNEVWQNKAHYDALIEHWINCHVFKDHLELTACLDRQIVLRVYEADHIPHLDDHVVPLTLHQWYCFNTYPLARLEINYAFSTAGKGIHSNLTLHCIDSLQKRYASQSGFDPLYNYIGYGNSETTCTNNLLAGEYDGTKGCEGALYQDCMIMVNVDDKTPPVAIKPRDLILFCDGAKAGLAHDICSSVHDIPANVTDFTCLTLDGHPYAEIECHRENDLDLEDSKDYLGNAYGYYSCITGSAVHGGSDHDTATNCNPFSWSPIYCHRWLCEDRYDSLAGKAGAIESYFWKPTIYQQGSPLANDSFAIWDNCLLDTATLSIKNEKSISACGDGWYTRTWTIQDACANVVSILQKLIVRHRSDYEVLFPEDLTIHCHEFSDVQHTKENKPVLSDDDCERLSLRYEDQQYDIVSSSCYKILRTWTIWDECIWQEYPLHTPHAPDIIVNDTLTTDKNARYCSPRYLKDNGDGYMQYTQVIKVIDTAKPVFELDDISVCVLNSSCETDRIEWKLNIVDACSSGPSIKLLHAFIDLNALGYEGKITDLSKADMAVSIDGKSIVSSGLPIGLHLLFVRIADGCGNYADAIAKIEVKDCKRPTPYCLTDISTVIMPSSQELKIWAKDFNAASVDNCTPASDLKFSFTEALQDSCLILTCADIPDGRWAWLDYKIWVIDSFGNKDFCRVVLRFEDASGNVCKNTISDLASQQNKETYGFSKRHDPIELIAAPNPFTKGITLKAKLPKQLQGVIRILDVQGRVVKFIQIPPSQTEFSVLLKDGELPDQGVYYGILQTSQGLEIIKLIKMN